jgi:crotonobetainyl-CoA:carnitine CoA-transferase CaiB-like acyl-CoA transferase
MTTLPLKGIRVLDLSRVLAGPLCSMMLGDLGADVVKIERQGRGDDTRDWGPPFDERGESAYFLSVNRNKLSVAVDLKNDRDREFVRTLASGADVVIENFLPGTVEGLGLSAADALYHNRKLVWCSITGFGAGSRRLGYDYVVQAESGWMSITGDPDGEPMKAGIALADVIAGKDATIAILAALVRGATPDHQDRHILISLVHSARAALVNVAQNALVSGAPPARWGNAHANLVPYQLFHAQDRFLVIAVGTDAQWLALLRALGLSELERDVTLSSNAGRLAQRERVARELALVLKQRPAEHWRAALDAAKVPCGVVKGVLEAIEDSATASAIAGMPSSVGGTMRFAPPRLDEHGELVRANGWYAFQRYR